MWDLNPRSSGHEPDEIDLFSNPHYVKGLGVLSLTLESNHNLILSDMCEPSHRSELLGTPCPIGRNGIEPLLDAYKTPFLTIERTPSGAGGI